MNGRKSVQKLTIDEGFKNLIRPLFRQEYLQLEQNILADGCREPISVWNGVIVDGHNRYEICTRHHIPFAIEELNFECREAAVAWICANQLGRRNLTEETRKFLIGMQYESEKVVNSKRNVQGFNQFSHGQAVNSTEDGSEAVILSNRRTANRIAEENHISHGTVEKYAHYTRALEEIGKKEPKIVPKILSGKYKIAHSNVIALSQRSARDIQEINQQLERSTQSFAQYQTTRREIQKTPPSPKPVSYESQPSVKDMPTFDPDAEITGLTLTIPSWSSSLTRVMDKADLSIITPGARKKLQTALLNHQDKIVEMLVSIREK